MLIHHFIEQSAARYPDKVAVINGRRRLTYRRLNTRADSLAAHLQANGIAKGDRVAIVLENGIDYIIAYYAVLKSGAVAAPLNPCLKPNGLQSLLCDLKPAALITNCKAERRLKACHIDGLELLIIRTPKQKWRNAPQCVLSFQECLSLPGTNHAAGSDKSLTASSPASIIYTSGSTGKPKGVMLSHGNIVSNTKAICQILSIAHTDIQMVVLPFYYVMGKSLLNTHMAAGGTVVINNNFMYPADAVHQMIEERVTSFSGVPSTYAYLMNRSPLSDCRDRLRALRYCSQAGGHMARSLKLALREALPEQTQIVIMYGATEAAARLTCLPPNHFLAKIDSIGRPIPDVTIRVMDDRNREVPDGSPGVLVADGPNIMMGYWNASKDTRQVLSKHGYHTGDIGYRDRDGFLYVTGRKDGLLKVSGHRINPIEIEDFLIATGLLIETAVIGLPDNLLGNRLVALVVPKECSCSSAQLMAQCARDLPNHKCPTAVLTTRTLPKNANGKIDREECVQMAVSASN